MGIVIFILEFLFKKKWYMEKKGIDKRLFLGKFFYCWIFIWYKIEINFWRYCLGKYEMIVVFYKFVVLGFNFFKIVLKFDFVYVFGVN